MQMKHEWVPTEIDMFFLSSDLIWMSLQTEIVDK